LQRRPLADIKNMFTHGSGSCRFALFLFQIDIIFLRYRDFYVGLERGDSFFCWA
jgi:hypothetical protein